MSKLVVTPAKRQPALQTRRRLKMAESAHAYVRGNTVQFYEWLQSRSVRASIPAGPDIWICGDCHTGNIGPVADIKGKIDIQIRDLDQTVIGNPAHDLLRLGLSLAMAARSSDLPGVTTALMLEEMIVGYISGLSGRFAQVDAKNLTPIRRVMRQANRRHWKHLAEERIEGVKPKIPLGPKFWSLTSEETRQLEELIASEDLHALVRRTDQDTRDNKIRLVDAAYWMKGCSSLGRLRYAALIGVGNKKGLHYRLLDVKEATEAAGPYAKNAAMPRNNARTSGSGCERTFSLFGRAHGGGTHR